jgi:pilus assembly protein CpaB
MVCQMMLQDVVVMKLGNFSLEPGATINTSPVTTTDANGQPVPAALPDIVTLIVTPQDSITLTYLLNTLDKQTRISMTLRNPSDQARQATEASTLQFLLSQYNIPVPAKLPYAMQPALTEFLVPSVVPTEAVAP